MNKRGQVGDTLTWFVAFIIIFFIMLIFMGLVISLKGSTSSVSLSGKKAEVTSGYYNYKEGVAMDFYSKNKDVLSKWADGGGISQNDINGLRVNKDSKENYDGLYSAYSDFIKNYDFKEPYFYVRTKDKEFLVESDGGGKLNNWRVLVTSPETMPSFRDDQLVGNNERVYFVSNGGNLILVLFKDQAVERGTK